MAETLAPQAAAKGLKLAAYVGADVPERVIGDPLRLQQILFNLLGNAIKFTETGSVRLSLENAGGSHALASRSPTPASASPTSSASGLFQPFVQADSTTTRRFGGTGLGLSIVRRLAEAMQGGVEVLSEPDKGSTFIVTVCLGEAVPAPARAEPPLQGLALCLALPDADEARAIARYFEDAGARVTFADSGSGFTGIRIDGLDGGLDGEIRLSDGPAAPEAAALGLPRPWRRDALVRAVARAAGRSARRRGRAGRADADGGDAQRPRAGGRRQFGQPQDPGAPARAGRRLDRFGGGRRGGARAVAQGGYDLVLADLQMPAMDGFELARRIRQSEEAERRQRTPILAVTASTLEEQEQKSRAAGMDGFITKPIGIEQLKATLDVWLKDTAA